MFAGSQLGRITCICTVEASIVRSVTFKLVDYRSYYVRARLTSVCHKQLLSRLHYFSFNVLLELSGRKNNEIPFMCIEAGVKMAG